MPLGRFTVLFLSACLAATAQDFRATVTGRILDSSGAAVAGVKIQAIQKGTNQVTTAASNSEGFYSLPYLQPSTYSVRVEAAGFRKMRRESVTLMVAESSPSRSNSRSATSPGKLPSPPKPPS